MADHVGRGKRTSSEITVVVIESDYGALSVERLIEPPSWKLPSDLADTWAHLVTKPKVVDRHFAWISGGSGIQRFTQLRFATWLPAGVFAALAAMPWLRWRFSVRTLLIATTLLAALLGLSAWLVR